MSDAKIVEVSRIEQGTNIVTASHIIKGNAMAEEEGVTLMWRLIQRRRIIQPKDSQTRDTKERCRLLRANSSSTDESAPLSQREEQGKF